MDCKCGIVTGINTYPANEKESLVVLRHLENQILSGVSIKRVALDSGYNTGAAHRGLELLGITRYIPGIQFPNSPEKFGFSYDQQSDSFICPKRQRLVYHRLNCNKSTGKYLRCYQVTGNICLECERQPDCFKRREVRRRILASCCYPAFSEGINGLRQRNTEK